MRKILKIRSLFCTRKDNKITDKEVGVIETKEKGGKVGDVLVSLKTYHELENCLKTNKQFKINYSAYSADIRETCLSLNVKPQGSHGFRWTFAESRVREYQRCGYSYEEALQGVSLEMKHFRASITEHYLSR